jgi:hypothetical protein
MSNFSAISWREQVKFFAMMMVSIYHTRGEHINLITPPIRLAPSCHKIINPFIFRLTWRRPFQCLDMGTFYNFSNGKNPGIYLRLGIGLFLIEDLICFDLWLQWQVAHLNLAYVLTYIHRLPYCQTIDLV